MTESKDTENSIDLIENAINENYFKYYKYEHFNNIQEVSSGSFEKVYRANWKNSNMNFVLKSFFNFNNVTTSKEIVSKLKLQREIDFHENIIRFYGITTEIQNDSSKKYLLVMEYADGGTLQNYLKEHFKNLTWNDKFNLALQLSYAVSFLHDEGIVHCDLHSGNVLIHKNTIKLDFGLSKKIEALISLSNSQSTLFEMIPYVDPKIFTRQRNSNNQIQRYPLNEKSDVYSIGMLLWEISSGHPPFCNEPYDISLAIEILQGLRETPVSNTPESYVNIYIDCWNDEPDKRPTVNQVIVKLKEIIMEEMIGLESSSSSDFIIIVNEVIDILNDLLIFPEICKKKIFNCLNNHNITFQETYNLLLNHQNNSNFVVVLGCFNQIGIGIDVNKQEAFELYQKAANLGNEMGIVFLGICYENGIGTSVNKQKAFELVQKAANLGNEIGMLFLGVCYKDGIGTDFNKQKAFELFQKAANLGNSMAQYSLGIMYEEGDGIEKNKDKAIYWYEKSAKQGYKDAQDKLSKIKNDWIETRGLWH